MQYILLSVEGFRKEQIDLKYQIEINIWNKLHQMHLAMEELKKYNDRNPFYVKPLADDQIHIPEAKIEMPEKKFGSATLARMMGVKK